jgi:hypothetical protein
MEDTRFDALTRQIGYAVSRRTVLSVLGGAIPGLIVHHALGSERKDAVQAERCTPPGKKCTTSGQCCSHQCAGKKKHKKCTDCKVRQCQVGMDACGDYQCRCPGNGFCVTTLSDDSFCFSEGACVPCASDGECNTIFGIDGAACIDARGCDCTDPEYDPRGRACVTPTGLGCTVNGFECASADECCSGGPCGKWKAGKKPFCRAATCHAPGESCDPALFDTDCCEGLCDLDTKTCTQMERATAAGARAAQTRRSMAPLRRPA